MELQSEGGNNYYISTKMKLITLSLAIIFLICGILMLIFKPDAPFYLDPFMESKFPYWGGLLLLALIAGLIYAWQFGEKRKERYYLSADGKLDLSTPRSYTKLKRPKIVEFFSFFRLKKFEYDGHGNVRIETDKGKVIESPLSNLSVKYWMDKDGIGNWYIKKMWVTDKRGNKLTFHNNNAFMDSEIDDIHMLLSTAGEIKESKMSKANKWANKLKDIVDEFDFSNLPVSVAEVVIREGVDLAVSPVINHVKTKLYGKTQKKSWFKKVMDYFWLTLAGLYLFMVLVINIIELPVIFGGEKVGYVNDETEFYKATMNYENNTDAAYENYKDEEYNVDESEYAYADDYYDEVVDNGPQDNYRVEFVGKVGNYPIEMVLYFPDLAQLSNARVEGNYRYTKTGSGDNISLQGEKRNEDLMMYEINDKGERFGYFDGKINFYIGTQLSGAEYSGTFHTPNGQNYSFNLKADEIEM